MARRTPDETREALALLIARALARIPVDAVEAHVEDQAQAGQLQLFSTDQDRAA